VHPREELRWIAAGVGGGSWPASTLEMKTGSNADARRWTVTRAGHATGPVGEALVAVALRFVVAGVLLLLLMDVVPILHQVAVTLKPEAMGLPLWLVL